MRLPVGVSKSGAPLAATLLVTLAACSGGPVDSAQEKTIVPDTVTGSATAAEIREAGEAGDRPVRITTESDRLWQEQAAGACQTDEFKSFFAAFSGSWSVREKYTAATVRVGPQGKSRPLPRQRYLDQDEFPISPMDYDYVTAESAKLFESKANASWRDLVYVALEINGAADNRQWVEWTPGIFEKNLTPPPPDLEEGIGKLVRQTGDSGYLLFRPTDDCWELVDDIRIPQLPL